MTYQTIIVFTRATILASTDLPNNGFSWDLIAALSFFGALAALFYWGYNNLNNDIKRLEDKLDRDINNLADKIDAETRATNARMDQLHARTDQLIARYDQKFDQMQQKFDQKFDQKFNEILEALKNQKPKTDP